MADPTYAGIARDVLDKLSHRVEGVAARQPTSTFYEGGGLLSAGAMKLAVLLEIRQLADEIAPTDSAG